MILEPKPLLPDPFLFLTNKAKTTSYKEEERICFFLKNFHKERNPATLSPRNGPNRQKGPAKRESKSLTLLAISVVTITIAKRYQLRLTIIAAPH
ncbi:hypothetical protein SOQ22_004642 [Salmonella enterica]|nr:hypothetical protein [Salmonella enterica]EDT6370378.1 hypothetical protein [Salmonella enterica subsp. enterica serovar Abaetetuba]EDT6727137.1 hypothetical protein [Salmonella enterica subsp. enterica serovar Abaetetuba]EDV5461563.1 hypothetical protein [Salmonella enterica subsp. enterica serovar Abaetetuba]EKO6110875.1 hypothetical protein [Salmonella enterica]